MPHISVLKNSKFLKKEDVDPPVLVTISGCTEINVAKEGAPEEYKWCLHLAESEKPMVLNSINGEIIAKAVGNDNTDHWKGHKIVLFHDPTVSFGGKMIGGIRARAPKIKQPITPPPAPNPPGMPATWPVKPEPVLHAPTPAPVAALPAAETDDVPF